MNFREIIEKMKSYDNSIRRSEFLRIINKKPTLKHSLEEQISENTEWIKKAESQDIFFILSYIDKKSKKEENITLDYRNDENSPVIILEIRKN